ncbi:MAG: hypothetical protein JWP15_433 [Alphaproteobacteria bacterium]|nr:hypothetical protein [Alphaproteobacteria bacterium]
MARLPDGNGRIAQLVEQLTLNQRVPGSSPGASTIFSKTYRTRLSRRRRRRKHGGSALVQLIGLAQNGLAPVTDGSGMQDGMMSDATSPSDPQRLPKSECNSAALDVGAGTNFDHGVIGANYCPEPYACAPLETDIPYQVGGRRNPRAAIFRQLRSFSFMFVERNGYVPRMIVCGNNRSRGHAQAIASVIAAGPGPPRIPN